MPFKPYDKTGLTSMSEAARLVGMSVSNFWHLAKEEGLWEQPKKQVGQRKFYTEDQVQRVVQRVAQLRKEGRVK